jgi:hypothetical protein
VGFGLVGIFLGPTLLALAYGLAREWGDDTIQARGIEPDLEVPAAVGGSSPLVRPRREADLPNALGNPGPIRPASVVAAPGARERATDIGAVPATMGTTADRQLAAAMALLRQRPLQAGAVHR